VKAYHIAASTSHSRILNFSLSKRRRVDYSDACLSTRCLVDCCVRFWKFFTFCVHSFHWYSLVSQLCQFYTAVHNCKIFTTCVRVCFCAWLYTLYAKSSCKFVSFSPVFISAVLDTNSPISACVLDSCNHDVFVLAILCSGETFLTYSFLLLVQCLLVRTTFLSKSFS